MRTSPRSPRARAALCWALCSASFGVACRSTPPEPEPAPEQTKSSETQASGTSTSAPAHTEPVATTPPAHVVRHPAKPVASVPASPDDPLHGKFTLADATAGLPGKGPLLADIETGLGKLECTLYEDKAPITVANFVGLARGLRPFKSQDGKWVKKPAYDGTTFHRVIKGFMVQGGDPAGTGAGEPGYVIPDEIWEGATHDEIGQICMANRGPNTNGQQFFIMDGKAAHLDGGYTIFGKCTPESVVEALASVEVHGDHSVNPTPIKKVTVHRGKAK